MSMVCMKSIVWFLFWRLTILPVFVNAHVYLTILTPIIGYRALYAYFQSSL